MSSHQNPKAKTPAELAEEKRLADEAEAKRQVELGKSDNPLDFLSGLFEFIGKFFQAIFGSLKDGDSEYSEIDKDNAQQSNTRVANAKRLLDPAALKKFQALEHKYEGQKLADISPFKSVAEVSSNLGHRNVKIGSHDHQGIDLIPAAGSSGAPVIVNTMPGVVVRSETQRDKYGNMAGFGNWVEVACIDGTRRRYGHLKHQGVEVGTVLEQGDQIGIMGNTGTGSGAHLHYEWRDPDGKTLQPHINDKTFGRDDRSYIGMKLAPAKGLTGDAQYATLTNREGMAKLPVADAAHTPLPAPRNYNLTPQGNHRG